MSTHRTLRFVRPHSCASPELSPKKSGTPPFWLLAFLITFTVSQPLPAQSDYATPYAFTTLAGSAYDSAGSADGTGSAARFYIPTGVAVDAAGNVYVADTFNYTIRKITSAGVVTTLAGFAGHPGTTDGNGSAARFADPWGVAVDNAGNVYVADQNSHTIRKITSSGTVTTLAGLAGSPGSVDGTGSAARFDHPHSVTVDSADNVYVADYFNETIRKITSAGVVTTLAGLAGNWGSADGIGSAARFFSPVGVAVDGAGNLYVADSDNFTVRKITGNGVVTTLAGLAGSHGSTDGTGSAARFYSTLGVAADNAGNVYVPDQILQTIRKITGEGVVTTLAGTNYGQGTADGIGSAAQFNSPNGVAVDGAGNLYVADRNSNTIRKGTPVITKAPQAITFAEPGNHTYGEAPFSLSATASSGLPVSFLVISGPATLSGNTLTLTGTGTVTLRASQPGNASFEAAPEVERGFTVAAAAIAPAITMQPIAQTVSVGSSVTLTAAASGNPVPTYQWQKNGADISGATSASLILPNVQSPDAGSYTCLATNSAGSATSAAATLAIGTIPAGFDVQSYLSRYPDVAALHGSNTYAAWLYYRDHGIYQGEVYDELFRVEEYLALYPDLAALFGTDFGAALDHWLSTGRIEGKLGRIPLEFSATGYFDRNPDVATAVGNNPILAWGHYWAYGIYEGRAYDEELSVFEYLAINADLTAAFVDDWRSAALHWMRYGRTEGRLGRLPLIFSATEYLNRNPDVAPAWGTNPTTDFLHFWLYGIEEGRTFDDEFLVDNYLALNPDLQAVFGSDRRGAFKHWVRYGRVEGRKGK